MKTMRLQERLDALRTMLATPAAPPRCSDCRWYVPAECRRHAPAPNARPGDARLRIFPIVMVTDCCGDYEAQPCPR